MIQESEQSPDSRSAQKILVGFSALLIGLVLLLLIGAPHTDYEPVELRGLVRQNDILLEWDEAGVVRDEQIHILRQFEGEPDYQVLATIRDGIIEDFQGRRPHDGYGAYEELLFETLASKVRYKVAILEDGELVRESSAITLRLPQDQLNAMSESDKVTYCSWQDKVLSMSDRLAKGARSGDSSEVLKLANRISRTLKTKSARRFVRSFGGPLQKDYGSSLSSLNWLIAELNEERAVDQGEFVRVSGEVSGLVAGLQQEVAPRFKFSCTL